MAHDEQRPAPGFRSPVPTPASDAETTGAGDVQRRIVLEATPPEVWRALTDPSELEAWWGEGTELDADAGGEARFVEDDQPVRLARVVEVRPDRRLVLDWWPEDPEVDEPATRVTIELIPCPSGTILTVVERTLLDLSALPVLDRSGPTFLSSPCGPSGGARALARV